MPNGEIPMGNGDWGNHRLHVIEELKQARIERHEMRLEAKAQFETLRREFSDVEKSLVREIAAVATKSASERSKIVTDLAVQKTKLDARASLFGAASSLLVIVAYLLIKFIERGGL